MFKNKKYVKRGKMKKILLILVLLLLMVSCKEIPKKEVPAKEITGELSELQVTACNTADKAGTCDTRLQEVGIVLKEECCEILGKCC